LEWNAHRAHHVEQVNAESAAAVGAGAEAKEDKPAGPTDYCTWTSPSGIV
jgi:hypothetical protein